MISTGKNGQIKPTSDQETSLGMPVLDQLVEHKSFEFPRMRRAILKLCRFVTACIYTQRYVSFAIRLVFSLKYNKIPGLARISKTCHNSVSNHHPIQRTMLVLWFLVKILTFRALILIVKRDQ